jgi:hypothetical protein
MIQFGRIGSGASFGGVRVSSAERRPDIGFDPLEQELLLQHAALGCISLWCTHAQSAYRFVFRTRLVKSAIPGPPP